jgi:GH35 family endo-1,4-beta-xylanase
MKAWQGWCVWLGLVLGAVGAAELPPGGRELGIGSALSAWTDAKVGKADDLAAGGKGLTVTNPVPDRAYVAQFARALPDAEIRRGDRVLVIVHARAVGVEEGELTVKLQERNPPHKTPASDASFPIYAGWRDYPVLFPAGADLAVGQAQVVLFCGQRTQRVEVASVRAWRYPETVPLADFPRIRRSYPGRESDAPWRKAALARIERDRKADFAIVLRGADGQPLRNAEVVLTLRRHAFGFGSAVPVKWLLEEGEDGRRYREVVDRYFSQIVFENDLKDFDWKPGASPEHRARRNERLDHALAWLAERHIAVRGHYLVQVARPPNLQGVTNVAVVREHFLASTRERLETVGNRVVEWDVINHPVAWGGADMLSKVPGLERLDREVFTLGRSLTKLPLLVNEDQLFRPGRQSDETFDYVQALVRDGFRVDGVGNQAHIHESFLPSPEHVLRVTDRFAQVAPRQVITEFDVITTADEELAADYTRDLLITCFSHPAYSGFLWWGFWERAHWRPEAASWNRDWTPRGRAAVFDEWIGGKWRTEATVTTDDKGIARWRGFPGWYDARAGGLALPMLEAAHGTMKVQAP